jgi:hypothetical protein
MPYVLTQPQVMATAAADVAAIGSTINEATAAAAGSTTGVVAAAADEISASIATLFNAYAQGWQAVIGRAAVFTVSSPRRWPRAATPTPAPRSPAWPHSLHPSGRCQRACRPAVPRPARRVAPAY